MKKSVYKCFPFLGSENHTNLCPFYRFIGRVGGYPDPRGIGQVAGSCFVVNWISKVSIGIPSYSEIPVERNRNPFGCTFWLIFSYEKFAL